MSQGPSRTAVTATPDADDRRRRVVRWLVLVLLGASVQVPVFWFLIEAQSTPPAAAKPKPRTVKVSLRPSVGRAVKVTQAPVVKPPPPPEEKPDPLSGQIVDIAPPKVEVTPPKAKYLAQYDSTVAKEVKARPERRTKRARAGAAVAKPSQLQSPQSTSREPTASPKPEVTTGQPEPQATPFPKGPSGTAAPGSVVGRSQSGQLLVPTLDAASAMANLQTLSGSGNGGDALLEVEDEGNDTVLNTRRFQHWDFFHTLQERVRDRWQAAKVYNQRDPTGKVYGVKDRLTVLRVTLDKGGRVQELLTVKDSGVEALDREAKRALRAAAPFENPPSALLNEEGVLTFHFSFLLELSTGRLRLSRARM